MQPMPDRQGILVKFTRPPFTPRFLLRAAEGAVNRLAGLTRLNNQYLAMQETRDPLRFIDECLEALGVKVSLGPQALERIPKAGPVVVVANHPFGGLEGLILARMLLSVRDDARILANHLLGHIKELSPALFLVDPFERPGAAGINFRPLRQALGWLKQGGLVAMFPAGEVASWDRAEREVRDRAWNPAPVRLALSAGAAVTPVYFHGRNRKLFSYLGRINPKLRTVMLPRELLNKGGGVFAVSVGLPLPASRLAKFPDAEEATAYLRTRTNLLKYSRAPAWRGNAGSGAKGMAPDLPQPPGRAQAAAEEIAALPAERRLAASGSLAVYYAVKSEAPNLLAEIGRLREISFRLVGEGTGQDLDLDRFDEHYLHLCLWDEAAGCLAGGLRLGPTDEILAEKGREGLYSATLFHYAPGFFQKVSPALEVGRSFVAPAYQRSYAALMLLWKAIAAFIAKNPHYRFLFGPVSVSADYSSVSRRLMMAYLMARESSPLSRLVRPLNPPRFSGNVGPELARYVSRAGDFAELDQVVASLEGSDVGVPVLLRQYFKLGSKALAWNLDPQFGNALDCLIVADLVAMEEKPLARYLGKKGLAAFKRHYGR